MKIVHDAPLVRPHDAVLLVTNAEVNIIYKALIKDAAYGMGQNKEIAPEHMNMMDEILNYIAERDNHERL